MNAPKPARPAASDWLAEDLKHTMVRLAANEGWFRQCWLGVPIWQLPEDLIRLQLAVTQVRPKWILETGTKYGGSAVFFASILELMGHTQGGVVTVDNMVLEEARATFREHRLARRVISIEGDAAAAETRDRVVAAMHLDDGDTVMVFLDDNHNAAHVEREMELYSGLVTPGSFLIVADTAFADLASTPVGAPSDKYPDVATSNPRVAVERFLRQRADFVRDDRFRTGGIGNFTDGFLRRIG
jgi:cephalosporin hydroxylase